MAESSEAKYDVPAPLEARVETAGVSNGVYNTMIIIPPKLCKGDYLTPIEFEVFGGAKNFCLFARYNEDKDTVEYALSGSPGSSYKMSISDGNSPYGWKVKRHGTTKTKFSGGGDGPRVLGARADANEGPPMDMFNTDTVLDSLVFETNDKGRGKADNANRGGNATMPAGGGGGGDARAHEEIFKREDIVAVPHASMRSSARMGIMDAKYDCVRPWSFYGQSLPEQFCRNKIKVIIYGDEEGAAAAAASDNRGGGAASPLGDQDVANIYDELGLNINNMADSQDMSRAAGGVANEDELLAGMDLNMDPFKSTGESKSGDSLGEIDFNKLNLNLTIDLNASNEDEVPEFNFPPPPSLGDEDEIKCEVPGVSEDKWNK